MEIMGWLKFITVVWPVIAFIGLLAFLVVFHRPLRQILKRFDCEDVVRMTIGIRGIELQKRRDAKHTRTRPRGKRRSARQ